MSDQRYELGYGSVEAAANIDHLVDTMDVVSAWPATIALRRWERDHLRLAAGERLLDVGCGPGDAALALADALGPSGQLVGLDASAAMVAVARRRATGAPCATRFEVGDAQALAEPDDAFDAARSERVLQWLTDPRAAVAELARVVRPGGRICLVDTDWSTLRLDVDDPEIERRVHEALRVERGRPSNVGRRLGALADDAGLLVVADTSATHRWTSWDPATEPVPPGCFSVRSLAEDVADSGQLAPSEVDAFVATVEARARAGRFQMSLTMFAVVATVPSA